MRKKALSVRARKNALSCFFGLADSPNSKSEVIRAILFEDSPCEEKRYLLEQESMPCLAFLV